MRPHAFLVVDDHDRAHDLSTPTPLVTFLTSFARAAEPPLNPSPHDSARRRKGLSALPPPPLGPFSEVGGLPHAAGATGGGVAQAEEPSELTDRTRTYQVTRAMVPVVKVVTPAAVVPEPETVANVGLVLHCTW